MQQSTTRSTTSLISGALTLLAALALPMTAAHAQTASASTLAVSPVGVWEGGTILDPNNGKTYRSQLRVVDGGKKIEVRGYIGIPLLGRSQSWVREQ